MSILLDTQTADRNLRDGVTPALNYTMLANGDVRINIYAGTFAKPCAGIAGTWQLYAKIVRGGLSYWIEPFPQLYAASISNYKLLASKIVDVKTDDIVQVILYSPNAGDTLVTVTAEIWHVSGSLPAVVPNAAGGLLTFGTGAGQINPDGTGKVPSSNAALATVCTEARLGRLDAAVSTAVAAAAAALTDYDPPTNAEMELRTLAAAAYATAAGQDEIKTAVDSVGNSEDTILNSESQVYNTDTADGSTVVNEES